MVNTSEAIRSKTSLTNEFMIDMAFAENFLGFFATFPVATFLGATFAFEVFLVFAGARFRMI